MGEQYHFFRSCSPIFFNLKNHKMNNLKFFVIILITTLPFLKGCDVISGIFNFGVGVGVLLVVAVLVIIFMISRRWRRGA